MLDENGGRNVFQKMLFLPKLVDLLKVVPNWHLKGKREDIMSKVVSNLFILYWTLTCADSFAVFVM